MNNPVSQNEDHKHNIKKLKRHGSHQTKSRVNAGAVKDKQFLYNYRDNISAVVI